MEDKVTVRIMRNGKWEADEFINLVVGDKFQIINPDGTYHYDQDNKTDWVTTSEIYLNDDGIWQVDVE